MLEDIKQETLQANLDLVRHGLVLFTWGERQRIRRGDGTHGDQAERRCV